MARQLPDFNPGDTVVVQVKVVEGDRERVQAYEGVVIAKSNRGLNSSFTVRKISHGEGVERVFQSYSPAISDRVREASRQRPPRQALLSARSVRQGRAHRRESLRLLRSILSGLWHGLDFLRRFLHLLVLLVIAGFVLAPCTARYRAFRTRRRWSSPPPAPSSSSCPAIRCRAPSRRRAAGSRRDLAVGPDRRDPGRRQGRAHPRTGAEFRSDGRQSAGQPTMAELAARRSAISRLPARRSLPTGRPTSATATTWPRWRMRSMSIRLGYVLVEGYSRYRSTTRKYWTS